MDIFYHSINYTSKGMIDVACCGAFKRKSAEEVRQFIEDLAKRNYRAPSETLGSSNNLKGSEVIELNKMTAIEVKLDELMNKLGNQDRRMHSTHEVGTMEGNEQKSSADEGLLRPNDIYKFMTLLPKDYFLILDNGAKNLLDLNVI